MELWNIITIGHFNYTGMNDTEREEMFQRNKKAIEDLKAIRQQNLERIEAIEAARVKGRASFVVTSKYETELEVQMRFRMTGFGSILTKGKIYLQFSEN